MCPLAVAHCFALSIGGLLISLPRLPFERWTKTELGFVSKCGLWVSQDK